VIKTQQSAQLIVYPKSTPGDKINSDK